MPTVTSAAPVPSNRRGMSRGDFIKTVSRYQGPELFSVVNFAALGNVIVPRQLNLNRPAESIKLHWRGRVVLGVANIAPIASEAPQTIIQRIKITGTHAKFNQQTPLDMTGASVFAYARLFQTRGSSLLITNGAGAQTRQGELGVPLQQVGATFGNTGTYDLEIVYDIPLSPLLGPGDAVQTTPYLWYPQDWADTIQMQLLFGDGTSFGTLGTTTVTFSSFGSGAGTPTVSIFVNYAILGPLANAFSSAVVIRNEQITVGGPVAAIANNVRLAILQKNRTLNVVLKTGTVLTGTSVGVQVFASLLDNLLDATQIIVDNKPIRNNFNNFAAKEYVGRQFNTVYPQGYINFTFVDSLNPVSLLHGELIPGGSTFELDSNVLTATANQAFALIQEQVFGDPGAKSKAA